MLGAAIDGSALTLGRMRGAAIVGQPLEVAVTVHLDAEESASSLCIDADVFHADARQESGRVRVSVDAAPQPQTATVRIASSAAVDEPIVTVYLKAGCGQKSTRRYVLLADFPGEAAAPAVGSGTAPGTIPGAIPSINSGTSSGIALAVTPAVPSALPSALPSAFPPASARPAGPPAPSVARSGTAEKPALRPREPRKVPVEKARNSDKAELKPEPKPDIKAPARESAEQSPKAGPLVGASRLKLDSLVMLAERVASLESSPSVPVAEVLRDNQRIQSLEADMKALVALATKNEANLMVLQTRLHKAEAERWPAEWFYALMALLAACLMAMAYVWKRQPASDPGDAPAVAKEGWWTGSRAAPLAGAMRPSHPIPLAPASPLGPFDAESAPAPLGAAHSGQATGLATWQAAAVDSVPATMSLPGSGSQPLARSSVSKPLNLLDDPESEVDVSMVEMSESSFDKLMASGQAHSALRKGPLPPAAEISRPPGLKVEPARSINSEALFDIRQQAEFFVSLGQTDQAVRILENRIIENGESSPLIYLDLLKILHAVGLKSDFRQFREDFNLLFNGKVPEFGSFGDEGKSLEEYPHVLAHIIALWTTPKVLMVIEASIFRDPWDDKSPPFELAAFRDLLLLHAIAQSTTKEAEAAPGPAGLSAAQGPAGHAQSPIKGLGLQTRAGFSQVPTPKASAVGHRDFSAPVGLDLDLDLDFSGGGAQGLPMPGLHLDGADFPLTIPATAISATASALGNGAGHGTGVYTMAAAAVAPAGSPLADDSFLDFALPQMDGIVPEVAPDDKPALKSRTKLGTKLGL